MKYKIFLWIFLFSCIAACQDDDDIVFDVMAQKENIRFKAIPGGAVMYYTLPSNNEVFGIHVRYNDAQGQNVLKVGSYAGDSLLIDGFNEARREVPAKISLIDRNNNESATIDVTFDTEESSTYAFFNNVEVLPDWDGFQVRYGASTQTSGMIHILYLGTNPLTQLADTILLESFPITQYGDTLHFALQQKREKNTVIIRSEDYRGYRVKQEVWENIEAFQVEKLELNETHFIDPDHCSMENENEKIGVKYLFDGDLKGEIRMTGGQIPHLYSFVAGPSIQQKSLIFDMQQERVPARVRIYGALNGLEWPRSSSEYTSTVLDIFEGGGIFDDKLPCNVTLYGSNDKDGNDWTELGSFSQDPELAVSQRWSNRCCTQGEYLYSLPTELANADPAYLEVAFPSDENSKEYRYIKLVINELFAYFNPKFGVADCNPLDYTVLQELEIYVKK